MKLNTLRVEKRDFLGFVEGIADDELVAHTFTFPCPSFSVRYTHSPIPGHFIRSLNTFRLLH